jgi:hypothetical protein
MVGFIRHISNVIQKRQYFELMRSVENNITGIIGLNYYVRNRRSFNCFLEILKTKVLIEKYT